MTLGIFLEDLVNSCFKEHLKLVSISIVLHLLDKPFWKSSPSEDTEIIPIMVIISDEETTER